MGSVGSRKEYEDEGSAEIMAEINITPLTDIFLVLLIIFMVTSSVMSQLGVDVDIPSASQKMSKAQPDGIVVSLLSGGRMRVNTQNVSAKDWKTLRGYLRSAFEQTESRLVVSRRVADQEPHSASGGG